MTQTATPTAERAHKAAKRYIYAWGGGVAEGDATMRERLAILERHTDQLAKHLREQHDHLAKLRQTVSVYQARLAGRDQHGGDGRDITAAPPRAADPAHRR